MIHTPPLPLSTPLTLGPLLSSPPQPRPSSLCGLFSVLWMDVPSIPWPLTFVLILCLECPFPSQPHAWLISPAPLQIILKCHPPLVAFFDLFKLQSPPISPPAFLIPFYCHHLSLFGTSYTWLTFYACLSPLLGSKHLCPFQSETHIPHLRSVFLNYFINDLPPPVFPVFCL